MTDATRAIYKGALLGVYGKTIQRIHVPPVAPAGCIVGHDQRVVDCAHGVIVADQEQVFRAGTYYYPVVGALVTGMVRARMHRLEHTYEATHTAVDAVHTVQPIPESELGAGIGQIRRIGSGRAVYEAANNYRVTGPRGYRKEARSGIRGNRTADELGGDGVVTLEVSR